MLAIPIANTIGNITDVPFIPNSQRIFPKISIAKYPQILFPIFKAGVSSAIISSGIVFPVFTKIITLKP